MTTYFSSRHSGAMKCTARQSLRVDRVKLHLDRALVQPGNTIIGRLPVNLAAQEIGEADRQRAKEYGVAVLAGDDLRKVSQFLRDWKGR